MKDSLHRYVSGLRRNFLSFTAGQKATVVVGLIALLVAGGLALRWAATPSYGPLYSDLSSADASAVIDQLAGKGIPYKISGGGNTILVPQNKVYETRITLSGEGLPAGNDNGYSILDKQNISTSQFKEQTDFKRAMEAELARTIESLDNVKTAVVHLAIPAKQVFADKQDPATASVLLKMRPGADLNAEQVQAVTNLVASSIDGLATDKVTVADSTGRVLSTADGSSAAGASTRLQQVEEFQGRVSSRIQAMLDRVAGKGNSTVQVTADLNFDKAVTETTRYFRADKVPALSATTNSEVYTGPGGTAGTSGVVGPDGQMDSSTTLSGDGTSNYKKESTTSDNAIDKTVEQREAAPGGVTSLHVGVVLDSAKARGISPTEISNLVTAAVGISTARGDTVQVSSLAFDRTAEKADAAALKKADAAAMRAQLLSLARNIVLVLVILLILFLVWRKNRRGAVAHQDATSYMVEQLRQEAAERLAVQVGETSPALVALERSEHNLTGEMRDEIAALVEKQPEDVAALLRGWLAERP